MPSGRLIMLPAQFIGYINAGRGRSQVKMTLALEALLVTNCVDNFPIYVWFIDGTYPCSRL
jgi:hypothetical protein